MLFRSIALIDAVGTGGIGVHLLEEVHIRLLSGQLAGEARQVKGGCGCNPGLKFHKNFPFQFPGPFADPRYKTAR